MSVDNRVGCVIVTFNNTAMLGDVLRDVQGQSLQPAEILVIDNSSDEGSARMIQERFPRVLVKRFPENIGSAGGFCEGIRQVSATRELVWLLDDDVLVPPESLEMLVAGWARVSCQAPVGAVRSWYGGQCDFSEPRSVKTFAWRGTLIASRAVRTVGLPRSEYFLYGDDTEYAWRMVKSGFVLFWIPQSRVLERREDDRARLRIAGFYARVYADKAKFYYAFRNQAHVLILYRRWFGLFRLYVYGLKVIFLILCSYTSGRRQAITAILRGLADGMRSRLGKNSRYSA